MVDATPLLPRHDIERAIKFSYAQALVAAVFSASTSGMFLIGYALKLGASNVHIGLLSTIPMLCVLVQFLSSALIERGVSRRTLTILSSFATVLGWGFVITIPYLAQGQPPAVKVGALIAVVTMVTLFAQVTGNARWSWVGDIIPESFRGTFFGRLTMYGGIVGTVFAIVSGRFLDVIAGHGVQAFSVLFAVGMLFGLVNSALFVPQRDIPITRHPHSDNYWRLARSTFANRGLMLVMAFALLWSMQNIAAPFYATYLLRDVGVPFLGLGLMNSVVTLTILISSPFWGRIIDKYGCRPVIIACTISQIPLPIIWIWLTYPRAVYLVLPFIHLLVGFASAGISVALTTLIYKVIPATGRSVQAAVYSVVVVLCTAPMPTLGGLIPGWLQNMGVNADLRVTFYLQIVIIAAAAIASRYLQEPKSRHTRELIRKLPTHLRDPKSLAGDEEVT